MGIWTVSTSWLLWTKLLHLCKFWGEPVCNSWVATWEWNCSVLWLLCLTFWGMLDSFPRDSTPSFLYLVSHSSVCWSALEVKNSCIAYHTPVQFSESCLSGCRCNVPSSGEPSRPLRLTLGPAGFPHLCPARCVVCGPWVGLPECVTFTPWVWTLLCMCLALAGCLSLDMSRTICSEFCRYVCTPNNKGTDSKT